MIKNLLKPIDRKLFPELYGELDDYHSLLRHNLSDCASVLDVGCGHVSPATEYMRNIPITVGVDGYDKAIETARRLKTHRENFLMDVTRISERFPAGSFDCVIALDLLEHLTPEQGSKILEDFQKIATKRIVVFTPNGFVEQSAYDNNPLQIHKSGWIPSEMRQRGYQVHGINGWKALRTEGAGLRWRPAPLWTRISCLTQRMTRSFPSLAFQMYCVKEMRR